MDDLVLIILTLLITVVGLVSQVRKKQQQVVADESGNKDAVNPGFWDEFINGERELIPQEQANYEKPTEFAQPMFEPQVLENPPVEEKKISNRDENSHRENYIKATEIESEKDLRNLPVDFSLRKAIIFSEILARKYF